jgi:hypothetical protein
VTFRVTFWVEELKFSHLFLTLPGHVAKLKCRSLDVVLAFTVVLRVRVFVEHVYKSNQFRLTIIFDNNTHICIGHFSGVSFCNAQPQYLVAFHWPTLAVTYWLVCLTRDLKIVSFDWSHTILGYRTLQSFWLYYNIAHSCNMRMYSY